ncbi:metal-dependent transcriptional regulator [candidate division KSB1 bacterium]|nr:metal-dependent transcriptional regulator [candidate division KSB1 bacterium]
MELSAPAEDCLLLVHRLRERAEPVSTSNLARELGVTDSTVTAMIQKLARRRLLHYKPRHEISLTRQGGEIASRLIRRHRLIECFLCEHLGYSWDEVHAEAERIEHAVSERFVDAINAKLGNPAFDPHGDPIPSSDGNEVARALVRLSELAVDQRAVVARVHGKKPETLIYLAGLALKPGARVRVTDSPEHDSVLQLEVNGKPVTLGKPLADQILLETEPKPKSAKTTLPRSSK